MCVCVCVCVHDVCPISDVLCELLTPCAAELPVHVTVYTFMRCTSNSKTYPAHSTHLHIAVTCMHADGSS